MRNPVQVVARNDILAGAKEGTAARRFPMWELPERHKIRGRIVSTAVGLHRFSDSLQRFAKESCFFRPARDCLPVLTHRSTSTGSNSSPKLRWWRQQGTLLFRAGQPCFGVLLVRAGKVALRIPPAVKVLPIDCIGPGAVLGLTAAVTGTYTVSARVVSADVMAVTFNSLPEAYPEGSLYPDTTF